jgi:hypothetical protein
MYGRLFSTWKRRAFCSLRGVVSRAEGAARESSLGAPQSGWGERCDAEHRNEGKVGGLHWRAPTYRRLRRHFFHRGRRNAPEGARARIDSEVNERRSCRTRACATRPSSVSASSSASPYKSIRKLKLCRFQGVPIIPASSVKSKRRKGMTQMSGDAGLANFFEAVRPAIGQCGDRTRFRGDEKDPSRSERRPFEMCGTGVSHACSRVGGASVVVGRRGASRRAFPRGAWERDGLGRDGGFFENLITNSHSKSLTYLRKSSG